MIVSVLYKLCLIYSAVKLMKQYKSMLSVWSGHNRQRFKKSVLNGMFFVDGEGNIGKVNNVCALSSNLFSISFLLVLTTLHCINFSSTLLLGPGFFFRQLRCSVLLFHIIFFCKPGEVGIHIYFFWVFGLHHLHMWVRWNHWCSNKIHPRHCRCLHSGRDLDRNVFFLRQSSVKKWCHSFVGRGSAL